MSTEFLATKKRVGDQGVPPDSFLDAIVTWTKAEEDSVFAPNPNPADIYAKMAPVLANKVDVDAEGDPIYDWGGLTRRKAVILEVMRVHAGFESSWRWREGVDTTNARSMANLSGQETGIFQVSFDSIFLGDRAMEAFADRNGIETAEKFIVEMKANHTLALSYYARLIRVNIQWAGPLKRDEGRDSVSAHVSRDAVKEFVQLLS